MTRLAVASSVGSIRGPTVQRRRIRESVPFAQIGVTTVLALVVVLSLPQVGAATSDAVSQGGHRSFSASSVLLGPVGTAPSYPTYLGNVERDGELSYAGSSINVSSAPDLHSLWTFNTNRTVASQAIVQSGVAYVGAWNGFEYALNASTGSLLWKTYLGIVNADTGPGKCGEVLGVTSTATYSNNTLYVYGGNSTFYALDPATGSVRWSTNLAGPQSYGYYGWSSPLIFGGAAYVGLSSQCDLPLVPAGLDEVSLTSHAVVHRFNTSVPNSIGGSIWSSPALNPASNTIYITTGNPPGTNKSTYGESIVSLNASTLTPDYSWQILASTRGADSDFGATPTLYQLSDHASLVTAGNKNGYLYTWYQSNLTLLWSKKVTQGVYVDTTAEMNGHLFGVTPTAYIGAKKYNSTVFSINPINGKYLWRTGLPGKVSFTYGAPIWVNGVLVVNDGSYLVALDAFNGTILYRSQLGGAMVPPPSVWGSELLVGHGDNLTAYVANSSSLAKSVEKGEAGTSFPVTETLQARSRDA